MTPVSGFQLTVFCGVIALIMVVLVLSVLLLLPPGGW